jgi:hypothetical protein
MARHPKTGVPKTSAGVRSGDNAITSTLADDRNSCRRPTNLTLAPNCDGERQRNRLAQDAVVSRQGGRKQQNYGGKRTRAPNQRGQRDDLRRRLISVLTQGALFMFRIGFTAVSAHGQVSLPERAAIGRCAWDVGAGALAYTLDLNREPVYALRFSQDGQWLAAGARREWKNVGGDGAAAGRCRDSRRLSRHFVHDPLPVRFGAKCLRSRHTGSLH